MQLRRVRAEEAPMRRYLTELWVPYHHELGEIVESKGLADTFALEDELAWQIEQFETPDSRLWVALDGLADPTVPVETAEATFAGFISTTLEPTPEAFSWPDRLVIGDFYVVPEYRGGGLADKLVARAVQAAREDGCPELALDVDLDNERALTYYASLGFSAVRQRMRVSVDDLTLGAPDAADSPG